MSEMTKKESGIGQLIFTLCLITALTALVLGLVNFITADRIKASQAQKTANAMAEVLEAESYDPIDYTGTDSNVLAVYQAGDVGYVVQVAPTGFSGAVTMVVGVNTDGTVAGVSITKHAETSGLGSNATKPAFRDQYKGGTGPFDVDKDGGTIVALTGATITSRAVTRGVNSALGAVAALS